MEISLRMALNVAECSSSVSLIHYDMNSKANRIVKQTVTFVEILKDLKRMKWVEKMSPWLCGMKSHAEFPHSVNIKQNSYNWTVCKIPIANTHYPDENTQRKYGSNKAGVSSWETPNSVVGRLPKVKNTNRT